ncbi:MAG: transposase [bacterium]
MRNITFCNGEFYHIYNRGVDKRVIFNNDADRERFLMCMQACNDANNVVPPSLNTKENIYSKSENPYVNIHSFVLMPNHTHFCLEQLIGNGISNYMARLNNSYTKYFNCKYSRSGRLFECEFKAKHITNDGYFLHLSRYIHLNALDLIGVRWRERGITEWNKAMHFLSSFRWSSLRSYIGLDKIDFVEKELTNSYFGTAEQYLDLLKEWAAEDTRLINDLIFNPEGLTLGV